MTNLNTNRPGPWVAAIGAAGDGMLHHHCIMFCSGVQYG